MAKITIDDKEYETDDLSDFDIPVQLIFGEYDALTPPSIGKSMQQKINNANLDIIKDAGHLTNMEQPDVFNNILLKFLLCYYVIFSIEYRNGFNAIK